MESKQIPGVGTTVRPVGSAITYRVVDANAHGCRVEAIQTEMSRVDGRAARPLHYSEKRFLLAACRNTGRLFDNQWRCWEVVQEAGASA